MENSDDLIYALVDLTFALADQTNASVNQALRELDLTHALANVLWRLTPSDERSPLKDLAQSLRCDPSTVTFLADRLEEKGLVDRRTAPQNRRVKTLELTEKGRMIRLRLIEAMTSRLAISAVVIARKGPVTRIAGQGSRRKIPR